MPLFNICRVEIKIQGDFLSLYNTELHNETKVSTMLHKHRLYTVLNKYM